MHSERGPTALLLGIILLGTVGTAHAENIDPDNDDSQYAWAENVGWINAEPAGCGDCGVEVSDFALTGWMWGENIGWISLSCHNRLTCGTVDYGVVNDGHGNLSGYAWAENLGWINFAPSTDQAGIDPATGIFTGRVWAENAGWIVLSDTSPVTYLIKTDWCRSVPALPSGPTSGLSAVRAGSNVELAWSPVSGADWYEVARGELSVLRLSGGDYSAATDSCGGDNVAGTIALVPGTPPPPAGDGYWYLVRGVNCKGKGTYDTAGVRQIGSRDLEVALSGADCP